MAVAQFQSAYGRYPGKGYPGTVALPNIPHIIHPGKLHVPTGATRKPRPGDALYYDATQNEWAIPTNAAELRQVTGVLHYDPGTIAMRGSSAPSGSNSPSFVEYSDEAPIWVGLLGAFYVIAGEGLEIEDHMIWDVASYKWDKRPDYAATAVANLANNQVATINTAKNAIVAAIQHAVEYISVKPFICMSEAPVAADGLAIVKIGYGEARV